MTTLLRTIAAVLILASGTALAQAPAAPPKPGPEFQRLGFFVGHWFSEAEVKANPLMPAGKMTTEDHCDWFEGHYAVVCHSTGTGPMGPTKSLGILSYSTEDKAYISYGIDNGPMVLTTVPHGSVTGPNWVFEDESKMGGTTMKSRYLVTETTPLSYTFSWEILGADGTWQTVMTGTATKK